MSEALSPEARLAEAMTGKSQSWLAKEVGVAASTINGYLKGKVPPVDIAFLMCKALNIDISWYINGEITSSNTAYDEGTTNIPLINSVGQALPIANNLISMFGVDTESLCCMTVPGTMMSPAIPKGAEVLATKSFGDVEDGRVYILKIKDTPVLRRVQVRTDGSLVAICDNPAVSNDVPDVVKPKDILALGLWSSHPL